jgi:hypothetical protein
MNGDDDSISQRARQVAPTCFVVLLAPVARAEIHKYVDARDASVKNRIPMCDGIGPFIMSTRCSHLARTT